MQKRIDSAIRRGTVVILIQPLTDERNLIRWDLCQFEIRIQRPVGRGSLALQFSMIGSDGILGSDFFIRDEPKKVHELQCILGLINFPAEQCRASSMQFTLLNKPKRIVRCAGTSAQDSNDQFRIIVF